MAVDTMSEYGYSQANSSYEAAWYHINDFDDADEIEDCGKRFASAVSRLENNQVAHFDDLVKFGSMYQNFDMMSAPAVGFANQMPQQICNISQAIIDLLVAKQVVNESKATFDVDDGDWEAHCKAEQLDRFQFGEMYRIKGYEIHEQGFRDCAWAGDGWIKYTAVNGKVHCERTHPIEMLLDPAAGISGAPRELYQVRYIAKSVAQRLYPKFAVQIAGLPVHQPPYPYPGAYAEQPLVRIVEGWHLPDDEHVSGDEVETDEQTGITYCTGRRGVYMFACGHVVLECKEWKRPRFPFVRMCYSKDISGGYSIGLQQQLAPLQRELNKIKRRKLEGLRLNGVPRMLQQKGSNVTPDFNTDIGQRYEYTGAKPEWLAGAPYGAEMSEEEQTIKNDMYALAGVSPLERGSDMPSRMDSRPGMREYIAAADEKHALPSQTWNRSFLEAARLIIDVAREIVEENGSYSAFGRAKDFITKIDFKDADLEDDRFAIKLQNTNLLPTTPTGKRLAVLDLLKANAFPNPMDAWQMMAGDHPDVDAILSKETAGSKLVEKQMYMIMVKRKYFAPDSHQDVGYAKSVAQDNIQKVLIQSNGGYDEDGEPIEDVNKVIAMLDDYIAACDDIQAKEQQGQMNGGNQQQQPSAQPGQQQPGGVPPGQQPGGAPSGGGSPAPQLQ